MNAPIHIAVTRRVRAGREREFEQALADFAQRSLTSPGARGVHLLHPAPGSGSREYGILRTFANRNDRDAFYRSAIYRDWLTMVEPIVEGEAVYRELHGLEAWFRVGEGSGPPRWKMALLTWFAVWPVSMAVPVVLNPWLGPGIPGFLKAAAIAAGIVLILTWLAMPVLVKAAHHWLSP